MSDLPNPDHSLFFGYYIDRNSIYGDFRSEIVGTINTLLVGDADLSELNSSFASAVSLGTNIAFYPGFDQSATTVQPAALAALDVAAPYWDSVTLVAFDEPHLTRTELESFIVDWHAAETARGLANKPFFANFSVINAPGAWQAVGIDYVGFECYIDPSHQNDPDVVTQLNNLIDSTLAFTGSRPVIMTIQGYNRNGLWTNIDSLKDIQTPPYLKGYNNSVVKGLFIFSYGRGGGTRELPPCIRTEHLRMWSAIQNETQTPSISCSGITPTPNYFYQDFTCGIFCKQLTCFIPNTLSGLYKFERDKTNDTLYSTINTPTDFTTVDVAIINPFAETGQIGE
jgi:hypothetical protein